MNITTAYSIVVWLLVYEISCSLSCNILKSTLPALKKTRKNVKKRLYSSRPPETFNRNRNDLIPKRHAPVIAGLAVTSYAVKEIFKSSELYEGVETHDSDSLHSLKYGKFSKKKYKKILYDAINRNDKLVVKLIQQYQWNQIYLSESEWNDDNLIEKCVQYGYLSISDGIQSLHK